MDDFFARPNKLNCYVAGLIAADGNVYKNRVSITADEHDSAHLLTINKRMGDPFRYRNCGGTCWRLEATNRRWVEDLRTNFNIVPAKSLILQPPMITKSSHIAPFIAGYVSGDGSVVYKKPGGANRKWAYLRLCILGTHAMLDWMQQWLTEGGRLAQRGSIWSLEYNSYAAMRAFYKFYDPELPLLQRKYTGIMVKKYVGNV